MLTCLFMNKLVSKMLSVNLLKGVMLGVESAMIEMRISDNGDLRTKNLRNRKDENVLFQ